MPDSSRQLWGPGFCETSPGHIPELKGGLWLPLQVRPVVAVAGQQESMEDAGHTSQLDGIHL